MKWSGMELLQAKNATIESDEMVRFRPEIFSRIHQIKGLRDVTVSGNIHYEASNERVFTDLGIEGVMTVPYFITLEGVEYDSHTKSLEMFSFEKANDEDVHGIKGDAVELLSAIFQLVVMEVPLRIMKKGLTQYPKGNGWEVVKEEDYIKEKSKEIDPRLAKLEELKSGD